MNIWTMVSIAIVVLLIIIGAVNRESIALLIRSKTNSALKELTNSVSVLELRISDSKSAIQKMVNGAGELFAQEKLLIKGIEKLKINIETVLDEAKQAKKDGNNDIAKSKLALKLSYERELKLAEENLNIIIKSKTDLERNISKLKAKISQDSVTIQGLKAREATNSVLKKTRSTLYGVNGTAIKESIEEADLKITSEELKLQYVSDDEEDENFSENVEEEFKNLK